MISITLDEESIMTEKKKRSPGAGGKREGAGRPKGSRNKLSIVTLLDAIEAKCGDSLENLIADGYNNAINSDDTTLRFQYERLLVAKCVVDASQTALVDGISQTGGFKVTFINPNEGEDSQSEDDSDRD